MSDGNRQFRDINRATTPRRLRDRGPSFKNTGFKFVWTFGLAFDALLELAMQGAQAAFPGLGTPTALPLIGRARGILRGSSVSDDAYAAQLQNWLPTLKARGQAWEVLRSIRAVVGPVKCRVVDVGGNWWTIDAAGTESLVQLPGSWVWDDKPLSDDQRAWVIIYAPEGWEDCQEWLNYWLGADYPYGGNLEGGNYTIGQTCGFDLAEDIRAQIRISKPFHVRVVTIIIAFDPDSFDPNNPSTWPDATWKNFTTGNPPVLSRVETARYWAGVE